MGKTRMAFRWDNIEILRAIDRIQGETYHRGPIRSTSGLQLMEQVSGKVAADQQLTVIFNLTSFPDGLRPRPWAPARPFQLRRS